MRFIHNSRFVKLALIMALILGVMVAGLMGNSSHALAQDGQHQTFLIQAGGFGPENLELTAFAPNALKVHRGDTVVWHFASFHNVHLGEDNAATLVVAPVTNGQPLPQINPAVAIPTIKNGDTYSGGDANTGVPNLDPSAPATFSLVIDLAPGNYIYYCDIHPGMVGAIQVVDDSVSIPSPSEVDTMRAQEIADQLNKAAASVQALKQQAPADDSSGKITIQTGTGDTGRVSDQAFFSPVVVVHAGDTVTWTIPDGSTEPHTVTSDAFQPTAPTFNVMPQTNAPPIVALGAAFFPSDKTSVGASDPFNSGILMPGQSYSVTFTEPGVFPYACRLHDGMTGVVIVEPKA